LSEKAKELLLSKRIAFTTPPLPKVGALAENEIGIGWNDLSPEARQTELNAALKDKIVKAAIEEAGLEVCKPDDWKPIVRERNPAAKKRWDAWEHWWPRSGVVRKEFLEREMAFAATQPGMQEAAAAEGVVPPSKEDFEKAKELISMSDFDTKREILLSTTSSYLDLCEYIQNNLQEIGLNVRIEVSPPSTHRQLVATSRLSFFRGSWIADYPDAENYLSLFYSKNFCPDGPNYTHFSNEEFDSLYEASLSEIDLDIRNTIYNRMDKIIIDNAVVVPLYYDRVLRFSQNNISGFTGNPMNLLDLKRVKK